MHGAAGGRPPGTPQHANTRAAAIEGRQRWLERMREAKVRGEIQKIPGGRRARGLPPRSKDRIIVRGQRLIEQAIIEMEKTLPAIPEPPWDEQNDAQFWAGNFRRAMYFERRVLDRPDDWGDMEFMRIKREVALAVTGQTVRMKVADLGQRADDSSVVKRLMERVAKLRRGEPVLELEPDAKTVEPTGYRGP